MPDALFAPVCAIAPTRRRRFLWVAWWTGAPARTPFRKPDAFEGGARTREEALRAAERAAGCSLLEIESGWARAWANVLVGKEPWPTTSSQVPADTPPRPRAKTTNQPSVWSLLGLTAGASLEDIKRAYRMRALQAHPDRGGSDEAFRALQSAYESALKRRLHSPKRR